MKMCRLRLSLVVVVCLIGGCGSFETICPQIGIFDSGGLEKQALRIAR